MKVGGFTFVANVVRAGYPVEASLRSLLPLVDDLVVVIAPSEDETEEVIRRIQDPRIRVVHGNPVDLKGPAYYAHYTDLALDACQGDWCIYLQADEVIPEWEIPVIRDALNHFLHDTRVEGMALHYRHFYGSPQYYHHGYGWYGREVRIVRNLPDIRAWGDAQGFRRNGRKLRVVLLKAWIHHYGWMLPPDRMLQKIYQSEWVRGKRSSIPPIPSGVRAEEVYGETRGLRPYLHPHPEVMREYLSSWNWEYHPSQTAPSLRQRLQHWLATLSEYLTGQRWFEYQNFRIVARYP